MGFASEFKEFAVKGNVIDLAVGVIIGAAFGKIVTSLVEDLIMPVVGKATGGVDFANKFVDLTGGQTYPSVAEGRKAGHAILAYGQFFNNILNFLIVAFCIFLMVRAINRTKREPAPTAPNTKACPYCTSDIALAATRCPQCTSDLKAAIA